MRWRMLSPRPAGVSLFVLIAVAAGGSAVGATFTVTSAGDQAHGYPAGTCPDPCTLRDAMLAANAAPGADAIAFALPGSGPFMISPLTPLPGVSDPVAIDGYTQPGAHPNTLAVGDDAVLLVELSGGAGGEAAQTGLVVVAGGSGTRLRGLAINRFNGNNGNGVVITGAHDVTVEGCFIGVDRTGTVARGNSNNGVLILSGATDCTIGGTLPASRNIISANSYGISVGNLNTTRIRAVGNHLGTNASGTAALGSQQAGVSITSASGNTVGGTTRQAANVISGNTAAGVAIDNLCSGNLIQGNLIGTDANGAAAVPNRGPGVWIMDGFSGAASGQTIGGLAPGAGNLIAFNTGPGVAITSSRGFPPVDNAILGNSIRDNGGPAIDLGWDGVTGNDSGDIDAGVNDLQNFPVVGTAARSGSALRVWGTLESTPSTTFVVQLYASTACDATGHGPAARLLAALEVPTDAHGQAEFVATLGGLAQRGEVVTAIATSPSGDTSEVSACRTVGWGAFRRVLRVLD